MSNNSQTKSKRVKHIAASPLLFHQRFNIAVDVTDAQKKFMNRVGNEIFGLLFRDLVDGADRRRVRRSVAYSLGEILLPDAGLSLYAKMDYYRTLQVIEAFYKALLTDGEREVFTLAVQSIISMSEVDLGIAWKDGIFTRTGAKLLDEGLVNEPLQWLSEPKYHNVLVPFEKGLRHYLEATKRPELLADVVTDMYEALEALAKIITGRAAKDLSANRELFVKKLGLSGYYKKMLEEYISYACEYRHGVEETRERATPSSKEVEAFIYTTGLFIRLAVAEEPSTASAPGT